MNDEIVEKIKKLRISKGFNHTEMADRLNITRSAYQRLESGETHSWAKYLDDLMNIFETNPKEFFGDIGKKVINQNNHEGSIGYVEILHQENKEITQELLNTKNLFIEKQQEEINFLRNLLNKK